MHSRHELGSTFPRRGIFVKTLEVYIFIQHAKMNISVENRDRDMLTGTLIQKRSSTAPLVSISTEQMRLHLAYGLGFCKWATPMEITVKFNSDVICEPMQFELIWCLQSVWIE